jgi:predicted DNA-binding transcriptional regulator AlpA
MSRSTLAGYLDCAESTVDDLVKEGKLPQPIRLRPSVVRWCRDEVDAAVRSLRGGVGPAKQDRYSAGVENVAINNKSKAEDDDVP